MGTNFYWLEDRVSDREENEGDIRQHIGKRSAAGLYCYDCGTTLNRGGTRVVHQGRTGGVDDMFNVWLDACPHCGAEKQPTKLSETAAGVELGFSTASAVKKTGVSTCSSFTWTLLKHKWEITRLSTEKPDEQVIVDEYGDSFTAKEFLEMLEMCPIEFQTPNYFF